MVVPYERGAEVHNRSNTNEDTGPRTPRFLYVVNIIIAFYP